MDVSRDAALICEMYKYRGGWFSDLNTTYLHSIYVKVCNTEKKAKVTLLLNGLLGNSIYWSY